MSLSREFARFVASLQYENLPPEVVDRAKGRLLLFVTGEPERDLEEWTVGAKSELLHDVFDLSTVIAGSSAAPESVAPKSIKSP